ncbi:MAG: hypothetical protein HPY44_04785 [Armatimonadetes bacterium]|nr:hypothetical protein [Armatimonadota bacterium]
MEVITVEHGNVLRFVNIQGIRDRIEELRPAANEFDALVRLLDAVNRELGGDSAVAGATAAPRLSGSQAETGPGGADARKGYGGEDLVDHVLPILADANGPMATQDILTALEARGIACSGTSARNTLYSALHRSDRVERVGRGLWQPAGRRAGDVQATAQSSRSTEDTEEGDADDREQ